MNSTGAKLSGICNVYRTVRYVNIHQNLSWNDEMEVSHDDCWGFDVTGDEGMQWSELSMSECPNSCCLKCGEKTDWFEDECLMCVTQAKTTCDVCGNTGHSRYTCPFVWKMFNGQFPDLLITMNSMQIDFQYFWNDSDGSVPFSEL